MIRDAPAENRTEQVCLWDQESVFMKKPPGVADSQMWVLVSILMSGSLISCAGLPRSCLGESDLEPRSFEFLV